jgi:hypothetical protein
MHLKQYDGRGWTELFWLRKGTSGGLFEHGDEISGSMKCGNFWTI